MELRKQLRKVHAWGGLLLGLFLIVNCITGSLLLWKHEYLAWVIPQAKIDFVPTVSRLAEIASAAESQFDPNDILQIRFATPGFPLTKVFLNGTDYAYLDSSGQIVARWHENERFEEWLYDLHHRLLLGNTGLMVTGTVAALALFLVLLGIYLYMPFTRQFGKGFWPQSSNRLALLLSHRNLGIVIALPLMLTLLTGVTLAFPAQLERLLLEETRLTEEYSNSLVEGLDEDFGAGKGNWLPAMERALATFPGGVIRSAQVPNSFSTYRIIGIQQPGDWNPLGMSRVYIDADGGYMDIRIDSSRLPLRERSLNQAYPLHTGTVGGLLYRLWLTFLGFSAACIAGLGVWSHAGLLLRRKGN